jgi:hypothetical protein
MNHHSSAIVHQYLPHVSPTTRKTPMANPQTPHESRQVRRARDQAERKKLKKRSGYSTMPRSPIYGCNDFLLGTRVI